VSSFAPDETFGPRTIHLPPGRYTIAFSDLDHFPMRRIVVLQADETRTEIFRPARRAHP